MIKKLKHFNEKELNGLTEKIALGLNSARKIYNGTMKITSGHRTEEHNKKIGGVKDSSHIYSLGVDIACVGEGNKKKMIFALACAGFERIIVYSTHIHADMDYSKTHPYFEIK